MIHQIADRRTQISESARARGSRDSATAPAVLADVLTLVETAQLVQTVLREGFPRRRSRCASRRTNTARS